MQQVELLNRAFGCLRKPIFQNSNLSVSANRSVYCSVVLLLLLYGADTWTIKDSCMNRLSSFVSELVHMNYTKSEKIQTTKNIELLLNNLNCEFGMEEPLEDLVEEYRLRWLRPLVMQNGRGKTSKDVIV